MCGGSIDGVCYCVRMHTGVSSVHYITSVTQCSEYCALRCAGNLYCVYLQVHHVMDRMYWWLLGVLVEYRIRCAMANASSDVRR